jgi:flagellar hook-length control protein FliK
VGPPAGTAATSPVFGTAGSAQTTPTARTETSGHVAGQVFPEVARMVTRGDGMQRLTLRLSPEALGDVRIVVTVRDGAVDVSLAAGPDAQEALRTGSPELRRLLESLGASSTQVSVRDLPSTGQSTGQSTGHSAAQQYGTDAGGTGAHARDAHGNGSHGRHTPAGGDRAAQSTGPLRPGPHDPTTPGTLAGLDLRL